MVISVTIVSVPRIMSMAAFNNTPNPTCKQKVPAASLLASLTWISQDDLYEVSLWGHVEAAVCVILACIPRVSIFFMRLSRKYSSRYTAVNLQSNSSAERGSGDPLASFNTSTRGGAASHSGMSGMSRAWKPRLFSGASVSDSLDSVR